MGASFPVDEAQIVGLFMESVLYGSVRFTLSSGAVSLTFYPVRTLILFVPSVCLFARYRLPTDRNILGHILRMHTYARLEGRSLEAVPYNQFHDGHRCVRHAYLWNNGRRVWTTA